MDATVLGDRKSPGISILWMMPHNSWSVVTRGAPLMPPRPTRVVEIRVILAPRFCRGENITFPAAKNDPFPRRSSVEVSFCPFAGNTPRPWSSALHTRSPLCGVFVTALKWGESVSGNFTTARSRSASCQTSRPESSSASSKNTGRSSNYQSEAKEGRWRGCLP